MAQGGGVRAGQLRISLGRNQRRMAAQGENVFGEQASGVEDTVSYRRRAGSNYRMHRSSRVRRATAVLLSVLCPIFQGEGRARDITIPS